MPKKVFDCSICGDGVFGFGNNPEPFDGERCCDDCNDRFVVPMRLMMGRGTGNKPLLEFVRKLAETGRMMVETRRQNAKRAGKLEVIKDDRPESGTV